MKPLTKQENRIAHLIAQGCIEKEIADKLFISQLTVHTHSRNIRAKIGAKNIADITRMYILSLPKASDVLKAVLFLAIQLHMVLNVTDIDLRRPPRIRTRAKISRTIKTKK
ncbi:helix-turn-helix transcriptional regulator [Lutibacter aestuarii]|uniref:Helix-turn-helix transcriptional regulator n=1 Tax=Lutibacter aestuarii TaxID=861111 RepID=A0ABW2ZAM9_9FLAO